MNEASSASRLLALIFSLSLLCTTGCLEPHDGGPDERRPAVDFRLPLLVGGEVELDQLRGKTVILDFWATWCAPCEVQMPVLDALWRERGQREDAQLAVVGISVDTRPAGEVEEWVAERDLAYPIALGDQELAMHYGAIGFPTLIVVDPGGGIHTHHTGVLSRPELIEILEEIELESASTP